MSILFALWCVASGVYTGFLCVRKGLNSVRSVTNNINKLTIQVKKDDAIQEQEIKVLEDIEIKEIKEHV